MSHDQAHGGQGAPPQIFGPVRPHLTDQIEDHERGWQERPATAGGRVPPLRSDRTLSRTSLAERFRQRVREAESGPPEGR